MADSELLKVMAEVLTEGGPMAQEQLVEAVAALGVELGDCPGERVVEALENESSSAVRLVDDRWAWLPALMAGRVFTHRVTEAEATHDLLAECPDLVGLSMLVENGTHQCLTDGAPIVTVLAGFDARSRTNVGFPTRCSATRVTSSCRRAISPGGASRRVISSACVSSTAGWS